MNDTLEQLETHDLMRVFCVEVLRCPDTGLDHWDPLLHPGIILKCLEGAKHGWDAIWVQGQSVRGNYMVRYDGHIGRADGFARAAVIALLRAKREEKK